jgi:hypothetical protein
MFPNLKQKNYYKPKHTHENTTKRIQRTSPTTKFTTNLSINMRTQRNAYKEQVRQQNLLQT